MLSIHQIRCSIISLWNKEGYPLIVIQNVRKIRMERGYSQLDIAEVLNTTQQQYSKYENGQNEIPVRHIITLCKFYGISSDWLLGLTDEKK